MSDLFQFSDAHRDYFTRNGKKVDYRKNQLMIWPADNNPWVYFLDKGLVKASSFYDDGTESILGYFIAGLSFAQSGAFFRHHGGADLEFTAVEPSVAYRVSREDFFQQLALDTDFNRDYLTMVLRNQLLLIDRAVYLGERSLTKRCILWLLFMAKYFGQRDGQSYYIDVSLTQDTIASLLNITRESAGKCLRQLMPDHVQVVKKHITIKDIDKLQDLY